MYHKHLIRIFRNTLKIMILILLNSDKIIKKRKKWEAKYDEHIAEVTGRNFLY